MQTKLFVVLWLLLWLQVEEFGAWECLSQKNNLYLYPNSVILIEPIL